MFLDKQRATACTRTFAGDGNAIDSAAYYKHLITVFQAWPLFEGKVHLLALDALPDNSIGRDGPNAASLVSRPVADRGKMTEVHRSNPRTPASFDFIVI